MFDAVLLAALSYSAYRILLHNILMYIAGQSRCSVSMQIVFS